MIDDYLYRGPIDTSFSPRVIPSDRIKYHCDDCGQALDCGVCADCAAKRREAA